MFKALNGPKRIKSLPDNYRSLGIAAALLICSLCASAQRSSLLTPYDSNRVFQAISGYGFGWNNVYIKGSIIIPNDTPRLALKDSGGIANKGGTVYVWTGKFWNLITGISSLDSIRNNFNNTKIVLWAGGIAKDSLAKGIIKYQIANFKVTNISPGLDSVSYIGSGGGSSKYTTNQYGIIIDSSTANLYKIKADSTVLLSKLNANATYGSHFSISSDSIWLRLVSPNGTILDSSKFTGATAGGGTTYTGTSPINVTGSVISLNTVPIASGGTNATTANIAFNNLAPTQTSNTGKYLTTDGTNTSWATIAAGGVTSAFGRTGAVAASVGDYNYSKITRNKQVHTAGTTVTVSSATDWLIVKPTLAALTITLEASPVDGQRVDISFKLAVTSLTVNPNTGQTIKDANGLSFVDAGESIAYQYDSTDLIWYRL